MALEQDVQARARRKLTKRRKPIRASSVQYPERLKEGADVQEDAAAVKGTQAQYMNQSVFSMIAAAGSKTDFHARFEEDESDTDEGDGLLAPPATQDVPSSNTSATQDLDRQAEEDRAKSSERKGLRSLPKLKLKTIKERNYMSQSTQLPARGKAPQQECTKGMTPRDAPVMGKLLEAQADLSKSATSLENRDTQSRESNETRHKGEKISLATRLMEIFGFERPEEVISGS